MADDPYRVLGVAKSASEDEVRQAYRKLAKQYHPDLHPDQRATSEERFKQISAAYDLLGDPDKRGKYDRGEIDANGEQRRTWPHGQRSRARASTRRGGPTQADDPMFGDFFGDVFGGRRGGPGERLRGQDQRYTLEVDFLESVQGARKRVTMPDGGLLELVVPEGVDDGQVLRLKGKGGAALPGGEAGDALVEIKVRPHPQLSRDGDDLTIEVPITLDEAVLGARIEVTTATGRVNLSVPKGTGAGQVLRLKGKGVKNMATGRIGDELVTIRIVMPAVIDDELSYFFTQWRQKHGYDAGRG